MRLTNLFCAAAVAALATPLTAAMADDVGVASCDTFLKTYAACVASKVPADKRAPVLTALDQTRANWKAVAATPDGKTKLDATCKETAAKMKKEVAALNCAW